MQRWYVTFHGGESTHAWNKIHVYDLEGQPLGKALETHAFPDHLKLRELRGFVIGPDGDLYVANAYKYASQVLRFGGTPGSNGKHPFREIYAEQHHANPGLDHPFDLAFGPDNHLYVSSQDTNIVGRYYGPKAEDGAPGQPMPHPLALRDGNPKQLLPGTFVPSEKHAKQGVRSVRRAIFGPDGSLYVADRDSDSIKRYDGASGEFQREYRHHHSTKPVHLAFRAKDLVLLSGSRNGHSVFAIDTDSGDIARVIESGAGGLLAPGGMAFGSDHKLYVCSRETKQILCFDAISGKPDPLPFIDDLEDFPEFISLMNV